LRILGVILVCDGRGFEESIPLFGETLGKKKTEREGKRNPGSVLYIVLQGDSLLIASFQSSGDA